MAQIIELLGGFPKPQIKGTYANEIFSKKGFISLFSNTNIGEVRGIKELNLWPLHSVLIEKYQFPVSEAYAISEFLLPMLQIDIRKRVTAADCLRSKWLHPYNL